MSSKARSKNYGEFMNSNTNVSQAKHQKKQDIERISVHQHSPTKLQQNPDLI